jgi:mono/diheme cytochrome c family protein
MISARMPRRLLAVVSVGLAATTVAGCGSRGVQLSKSNPYYHGAKLFANRCSDCHTLDVAGAEGAATKVRDKERTDGPNFNVRKEQVSQVLYAIRNGGFSGAIMPENIAVGPEAQAIAQFLARYSGLKAKRPVTPNG